MVNMHKRKMNFSGQHQFAVLIYAMFCFVSLTGVFTEGANWYVSRKSGDDKWPCDLPNPCKTIAQAVNRASSGDHIYLNGADTDKDPYNCSTGRLYINKSLSFQRFGQTPQIRCLNWTIVDQSVKDLEMNITLSGLLFNNTAVNVRDSSAAIDGCEFAGPNQGVWITVTDKAFVSIHVMNSLFWKNAAGLALAVDNAQNVIRSHVLLDVKNTIFRDKYIVSGVDSGNLIDIQSSVSFSCDLVLDNVTFTNNVLSEMGLVCVNSLSGHQNISLQDVAMVGNNHLCPDGDCTEVVVNSYNVSATIAGSNFSGLSGRRAVKVTAIKLTVHVYNSSFSDYGVNGDGGALLILALSFANVSFVNSSFFATTAFGGAKGGAVYIQCPDSTVTLHKCVFKENQAGSGGGISISAFAGHVPTNPENIALKEDRFSFSWDTKPLLAVYISDCIFQSLFSDYAGGGAVSVTAPSLLIDLRNSTFLSCNSYADGGALLVGSLSQPPLSVVLFIEQSYFAESNSGRGRGGAIFAKSLGLANVTIKCSKFVFNSALGNYIAAGGALAFSITTARVNIEMKDSQLENNIIIESSSFVHTFTTAAGGAIYILIDDSIARNKITIKNTTFANNTAVSTGGAVCLNVAKSSVVVVESSLFVNNTSLESSGGALYIEMPWDTLEDAGCINKSLPSVGKSKDAERFPKWDYITEMVFKDTKFKHNTAQIGGALYLHRGKSTFQNCTFLNNFASGAGGTIYTEERSTSVVIQDSFFLQSKTELIRNSQTLEFPHSSFIHTESTGPLVIQNTTMNATRHAVGYSMVHVGKGGLVDFDDNSTQLYCPVGSKIQFLNFSNTITTGTKDDSCTIEITELYYYCLPCSGGLYSLQRGHALGTHVKSGFECLTCPFGANCSKNIVAKDNFWGFEESHHPPSLKFTICPLGYCGLKEQDDSLDYNNCQGNRSGVLCGECKPGFTETLYSTSCRPVSKCRDDWFWPVAALYVFIAALYLTFKPPFLSWIKRQILWFKESTPATQEPDFDRGYLKIGFYFYQAGDLLLVSENSSKSLVKTYFVEPIMGLFNFQQKLSSSSGFICPFPGLTVVTKRLFSTFHVFGTLVAICLLFGFHLGFQLMRGRDDPIAGPYLGGILQILLLGYAILGSVSFDLLRCVTIGSEWRLFYDGNVVCYQWWQYVLIAFVVTFIIPFGFVLFWGALKLHREALSVKRFLFACIFPAPFLIHWLLTAIEGNSNDGNLRSSQFWTGSIEKVLYDPFKRPEDGKGGSLNWESVLIGRRLVLIVMKSVINDPLSRLMLMIFFSFLVLLHHLAKKPFRDPKANAVETISLLSLIVLGMVNLFPASFLSLAVTSVGPFAGWLSICSWVEVLILGFVPALFASLVVAFIISQVCRLIFYVCRSCGLWSPCCRFGNRYAELLTPVT